jgi:exodeoxyribonuclease V gamma subunit
MDFFRNPSRYLLKRRMHIELRYEPDELQDSEPFLLDWRGRNSLALRLVPRLIRDPDDPMAARLIEAGTEMPTGNLGAFELARELKNLREFAVEVRRRTRDELLAPHQASTSVRIGDEDWRIGAGFPDLRATGLVRWKYAEQRGIDALRPADALEAWLSHLLLCADPPRGMTPRTTAIARNGVWTFRAPQDPGALLRQLVGIYRRGLAEPVHFFPKSAWAYCHGEHQVSKALQEWRVTAERPYGESGDVAYQLAFRGRPEPIDEDFRRLAEAVYDPLIAHCDRDA